jgi:hypothetical protein
VVCQVFVLLTRCVAFDVFHDPGFGARPKVFFIDALNGFVLSRVTIDRSLMPYVHQLMFQSLIWWDNKVMSLNVSPEWLVWVVHTFDWICSFPFFYQSVIMVLDYCYCVFNWAIGVGAC